MYPAKSGHSMDKGECGHKMMNFDTIRVLVSLLFPPQASQPHPEQDPCWIQLLWIQHPLPGAYSQVWEYLYPHITSEVLTVQRELQRNSNLPSGRPGHQPEQFFCKPKNSPKNNRDKSVPVLLPEQLPSPAHVRDGAG